MESRLRNEPTFLLYSRCRIDEKTSAGYNQNNKNHSKDYLESGYEGVYIVDSADIGAIQKFTGTIYEFDRYAVAVIQ